MNESVATNDLKPIKAILKSWEKVFPGTEDLLEKLKTTSPLEFSNIFYAFGKFDKVMKVCKYLESLEDEDTEKIRITMLVSLAEATYRLVKPKEKCCENLVKGFFKPVEENLRYKMHLLKKDSVVRKKGDSAEALYTIRSDYIHNGNFTGVIFGISDSEIERHVYSAHTIKERETGEYKKVFCSCSIEYADFLKLFGEGFIAAIHKIMDDSLMISA